ncbi:hypothetical protein [Mammaliicoccus lentus]|uniref:hypothetical protein n=1 Tax=Mammaliicoccus lentus TaxID=42858 RepID=UPI0010726C27|nr:hypothetical protein [Mammaliicoccus lentus]MBF0793283.1 hypothetical protein [Mammaliicoccus lentus]TFV17792.1 hypothetical protein E4T78_01400 [Mammaliicoccus lentus]
MKILTYEEIEKEIEDINLDFRLSLHNNEFTIFTADKLLERCFSLVKHFDNQSKFKRVFKRMLLRRRLNELAIEIYDTQTK